MPFTRPLRTGAALAAVLAAALAAVTAVACSDEPTAPDTGTFYGAAAPLGDGTARTYVVLDRGAPVELGVALSETAFTGLQADDPSLPGAMTMPDGHSMFELDLAMPAENPTPYRFAMLNWNPGGHEPPGIYDKPHFDFHFYLTPVEAVHAIVPDSTFAAKSTRYPSTDELPAGYAAGPAVPMMGTHWLDPKTPELNGGEFTQTFIAGTWDGRATFLEPMITKAFLEAKPDFRAAIPAVKRHAAPGWYPRGYAIRWDASAKEYRIALRDFAREG